MSQSRQVNGLCRYGSREDPMLRGSKRLESRDERRWLLDETAEQENIFDSR